MTQHPDRAPELRLRLLGGFTAFLDGHPLTELRSAKAAALLAYLAVTGRPQPRAVLAGLLWPSLDEAAARLNLRQVLHILRRLVGDHIAVTRTDVMFRRGPGTDVDVHALETGTTGAPPEGEFLIGFSLPDAPSFDDWSEAQRQRLQRLAGRRWAEHAEQLRHSDPGSAMLATDRVLALDPWNERALRHLMLLLAENGQRGTALGRYDTFRRRLADELGIDPDPETRQLHQRLLLDTASVAASEPTSVPPPRVRAPLPVPPGRLIGRAEQLDQLDHLLGDPATRLVTLVGPGGVGKTRLAIEAARRYDGTGRDVDARDRAAGPAFPDGVVLVPLDVVPREELIGPAVLAALGRQDVSNNRLQAIVQAVQDRRMLLVLDNLEHLPGLGPRIAELVASCPNLHVLATSRTALNLRAETVLDVPPLAVPDLASLPPAEALDEVPAVALLLERMRRQLPGLNLDAANARPIAELCVRLDGLPLALELAAGRARAYGPAALAALLDSDSRLLDEGPVDLPARHRSLSDTLAWSHALLSPAERQLFRRLSVFAGSWTVSAAEAVCWDDDAQSSRGAGEGAVVLLPRLLAHSLLRATPGSDGEPRFGMLRTIRDFAARQLEAAGETGRLRRRHAEYYRAFAAAEAEPLRTSGQAGALRRLAADHDNLRRAMRTFVAVGEAEHAAGMAWSLWLFWHIRAHYADGLRTMDPVVTALEADRAGAEPLARARTVAGVMAYPIGELDRARTLLDDAISDARMAAADDVLAVALMGRGLLAQMTGDVETARWTVGESHDLFVKQADPLGAGLTSTGTSYLALAAGDRAGTTRALGRAEEWARTSGAPFGVLAVLNARLLHTAVVGDAGGALQVAGEMVETAVELGDVGSIGYALLGIAFGSAARGDLESAAVVFGAEERLREFTGTSLLLRSSQEVRAAQLAGVRAALPGAAFQRLVRQGRAMSLSQTIAMALALAAVP